MKMGLPRGPSPRSPRRPRGPSPRSTRRPRSNSPRSTRWPRGPSPTSTRRPQGPSPRSTRRPQSSGWRPMGRSPLRSPSPMSMWRPRGPSPTPYFPPLLILEMVAYLGLREVVWLCLFGFSSPGSQRQDGTLVKGIGVFSTVVSIGQKQLTLSGVTAMFSTSARAHTHTHMLFTLPTLSLLPHSFWWKEDESLEHSPYAHLYYQAT